MDRVEEFNLTGTWNGQFRYPHEFSPQSFVAEILQSGQYFSGTIEDLGVSGSGYSSMKAVISGSVVSGAVSFIKIYNLQTPEYDAVHYEGFVFDEGREVHGRWTIPGEWSGDFLMIRSIGTTAKAQLQVSQVV